MTTVRYRPPARRADMAAALAGLASHARLTSDEAAQVRCWGDWRADPPGMPLTGPIGPAGPRLLIDGWVARVRLLADGRRQIFNFVLPGEFVDLPRPLRPGVCTTQSLTAVQSVDAGAAWRALAAGRLSPGLARALRRSAAAEDGRVMDQVVRLGRSPAYERVCQLLAELHLRAAAIGASAAMPFPLSQEMLADATGLSVVHVNRILQRLRREALVQTGQGSVVVLRPGALAAVGGEGGGVGLAGRRSMR